MLGKSPIPADVRWDGADVGAATAADAITAL